MATNNYWDESKPLNTLLISDIPGTLRNIKANIEALLGNEHETFPDDGNSGAYHSNGSAVAYQGSSTPTDRPDGSTALASNNIDKGRLWIDDTYDPPVLKRWDGSTWETLNTLDAGTSPAGILYNTTEEDVDGGRESRLKAYGKQSGGERSTLGWIEFGHDGASDDQRGYVAIDVNDGDDSDAPSKRAIKYNYSGNIDVDESLCVLDEDDMASDSSVKVATQQSIKAYVDNNTPTSFWNHVDEEVFNGTVTTANTYQDLDLSGVTGLGANRALVFLRVQVTSATNQVAFRPNGDSEDLCNPLGSFSTAGGASCVYLASGSGGQGYVVCSTDTNGRIEWTGSSNTANTIIDVIGFIK